MRWSVNLFLEGRNVLSISEDHVAGKDDFTEEEAEAIRDAAVNILSFIGPKKDKQRNPSHERS